jgi:ABC-type transport system substrate-binding protein
MKQRWFVLLCLIGAVAIWSGLSWAQQPGHGGSLRIAMPGDMTFFNANQGPAPGYCTMWVWENIFNSLLTMTAPPEWKVVPELARSWEVQDGGKTWVFHLNVTGYPFYQAYGKRVRDYSFYDQAYFFLEKTQLEN